MFKLIAVGILLSGVAAASLATDYPGPWKSGTNVKIAKALAGAGASGCGEFYSREKADGSGEHIVYCTSDGSTWRAYIVFESSGDVMGPYPPDPSLSPPR